MKEVEFLIEYRHTTTRTWKVGDRPTITNDLAEKLKRANVVKVIGENNPRGIDEDDEVAALEDVEETPQPKMKKKNKS